MVEWNQRLNGHDFEQALAVSDGQGGLGCCSPWGCKESGRTEWAQTGFPGVSVIKNSHIHGRYTGDVGSILESERALGGRHGTSLQYSCLENPMDRGSWHTTVHRVTKNWTWLNDWVHIHFLRQKQQVLRDKVNAYLCYQILGGEKLDVCQSIRMLVYTLF